jgi:hypothetical protein
MSKGTCHGTIVSNKIRCRALAGGEGVPITVEPTTGHVSPTDRAALSTVPARQVHNTVAKTKSRCRLNTIRGPLAAKSPLFELMSINCSLLKAGVPTEKATIGQSSRGERTTAIRGEATARQDRATR